MSGSARVVSRAQRLGRSWWGDVLPAAAAVGYEVAVWSGSGAEFYPSALAAGELDRARWLALGLAVIASTALAARRHRPVVVLAVVAAAAGAASWLELPVPVPAPLLALYSVGAHAHRRRSLPAAGAVLVLLLLLALREPPPGVSLLPSLLAGAVSVAGVWALGAYTRARRQVATFQEQARGQHLLLTVTQERAQIARELHDVLAHSVSVMTVQAGAARRQLRKDPDAAEAALRQVEATGRDSVAQLQRLVQLLRGQHDADLTPQPGLQDVPDLVEQFRGAGLPVRLEVPGEPVAADWAAASVGAVGLSVYRIVQEALTNVLRHAAPTQVLVRVESTEAAIRVLVRNDGVPAVVPHSSAVGPVDRDGPAGGGHGLVGMRERAALLGGTFRASAADGVFLVDACLPAGGPP